MVLLWALCEGEGCLCSPPLSSPHTGSFPPSLKVSGQPGLNRETLPQNKINQFYMLTLTSIRYFRGFITPYNCTSSIGHSTKTGVDPPLGG